MNLDIAVTSACNLGCKYCSEGRATIDQSRIKNSQLKVPLEIILKFIDEFNVERIGFWGGEPFINFKFCKDLMLARPNLRYMFYTNAMYIEKYLKDLIEIKSVVSEMYVQVSYDGEAINRNLRVTKSGFDISDKVKNAIKLLIENKISTGIKSTVTPDNFKNLFSAFTDVISLSSNYFPTPDTFSKYDQNKWSEYYSDLKVNLIKIAQYIYHNNLHLESFKWFSDSKAICSVGNDYYALDIDGYLFPCHSAMYSNLDHKIASIFDIDLKSKLQNAKEKYSKLQSQHCDCEVRFCLKCPIGSYNINSEGSYDQRFTSKNQDLCKIFKLNYKIVSALKSLKNRK